MANPNKKAQIPASESYLSGTTKDKPIIVGDDMMSPKSSVQINFGQQTKLEGTALYKNKTDYEISADEQAMLQKIGPRENIIQARSYVKVVEIPGTPSEKPGVSDDTPSKSADSRSLLSPKSDRPIIP